MQNFQINRYLIDVYKKDYEKNVEITEERNENMNESDLRHESKWSYRQSKIQREKGFYLKPYNGFEIENCENSLIKKLFDIRQDKFILNL